MKRKPIQKLKPINRLRREIQNLQNINRKLTSELSETKAYSDSRADRLNADIQRQATVVAEKNKTISEMTEEIRRRQNEVHAAHAERDRICHIVNQFLTVQIMPYGSTLQPFNGGIGNNLPASLRDGIRVRINS